MVNCPACDTALDIDEDELDEGDEFTCDECGAELAVVGTDPLEIEPASDGEEDDEDDDDDDLDEDEDEDEEADEEDDEEDDDWK
jgi:alpha-aminoadipate carrier protein LysW